MCIVLGRNLHIPGPVCMCCRQGHTILEEQLEPRFLHKVGSHVSWMDHRVVPEASAMFASMMSRAPLGGIRAKYMEIVHSISEHSSITLEEAENALCEYPLHPVIQSFFDKFVGEYGHGSIKENTARPLVFVEDISWWLAYLSFDNPLVSGQEMSTRAIWRHNWNIASDIEVNDSISEIHSLGLEISRHEIEAWKQELRLPCLMCAGGGCDHCDNTGKKYSWMNDPQAFRPAFDMARWALPGTISTGVSHCANVRVMGRVIKSMESMAVASGCLEATLVIDQIKEAYSKAMPGMAGMWYKEAIHGSDDVGEYYLDTRRSDARKELLHHINFLPCYPIEERKIGYGGPDTEVDIIRSLSEDIPSDATFRRKNRSQYIDPIFNSYAQVDVTIRCSLAAARDWHRHRTMMPWVIRVQEDADGISIDHNYEPISEFGRNNTQKYVSMCNKLYNKYMTEGNQWMAMVCLPLGTRVSMRGQGGLQHAVYMCELRGFAHGANAEYKKQARAMLEEIEDKSGVVIETGFYMKMEE